MRIKKYTLALMFVALAGPLLDLLTGYSLLILNISSLLTPGVIYRGFVLVPVFVLLTFHTRTHIRLVVFYFAFVFFLAIGVHYVLGYEVNIGQGVQRYLKMLLPILGLGALLFLHNKYPKSRSEQVVWGIGGAYGLVVALSIVGFFLTGSGLQTYRLVRYSSAAVFDDQNAVGIVLVLSLPMLLYYLYRFKHVSMIVLLTVEGLWLFSAFLLATRMAIIGVPTTILLFHLFIFFNRRHNRNIQQALYKFILLAGILLIGILIYQFWAQQDVQRIFYKFELLSRGEFRRRVPDGIAIISQFSVLEHLFGIGDAAFALTENDLVDIYGKFGLAVLIPLLLFYLSFYSGVLLAFLKKRSLATFVLLICFTFYIFHAVVAGHALANAQVNNLFIFSYFLAYKEIVADRSSVPLVTETESTSAPLAV